VNLARARRLTLPARNATAVGIVRRDGGVFHLFSDGGLLPVVRGGAPDDDPDPKTDPDAGKTFTETELAARAAKEKSEGERNGRWTTLERLGLPRDTDLDALKSRLEAIAAAEEAQKTEAQREKDAAETARRDAEAEKASAAQTRHAADVERFLLRAGVGAGETDEDKLAKALGRAAALIEREAPVGSDAEKIKQAVADLKQDMPALFGAAGSGGQPDGDPAPQTRKAGDGQKSGVERGKAKAAELGWTKEKQTA
jgi:hypothetical protein